VAAVLVAFLVRFPNTRIQLWWMFGFGVRSIKFWAKAYWLLPLWLAMEIFSGAIFGRSSGVAHWAHVGGFVFGAVAALGLRHSGVEHKANEAIEAKVSWTADPAVVQATEKMQNGQLDDAIAVLTASLPSNPNSLEVYTLLSQLYWRKNDLPKYRDAVVKALQLHLKGQDFEGAWRNYEEFLNSGGERLPASPWLELCRSLEGQQNFDRAVGEYDKLARAYPAERQSLLALMSAGRLSLKQLNRPAEALGYYKAAASAAVPHLDWQPTIDKGIQDAEKALSGGPVPVG
jgi:tetratricopeptide (TPR) repeat protein